MKNLLFILLFFGLKAASQTAFPLYVPTNPDSIKQVVTVNGSPRQVYNIDLVKYRAALIARDTATALRLLISSNTSSIAANTTAIGLKADKSATISINGSSQVLGSNPSFTIAAGSGGIDSVKLTLDSLKFYKAANATPITKVALYSFANLRNGDYLKYDSINKQWINTTAPVSTSTGTSTGNNTIGIPTSDSSFVSSLDNRIHYKSSGTWYIVAVADSGGSITETALTFPTQSPANGLTNTSGLWTPVSTTAAYGNLGLSGTKLPAGSNGYILMDWTSGDGNAVLGFSATNATTGFASMKAAVYITPSTGEVLRDDAGGSAYIAGAGTGGHYVLTSGDKVKINRTGSVITLQRSTDNGVSFSPIYTYAYSSSGDLYVTIDLYGAGGKMRNPKQYNLR